ncbi:unnamed protein product [Eruca vesicaria subsp. sativa]|uniref:Glyceraldehyde 3-phosphate dehydrogenase catalytic domain-containing protein n=1 Tax=Eruca vesicaria subsp. sativa TaxID=29727 RepID=A0ABC8LN92_ERUVS|nr:unnamed protein product [Eruca vesicaria subsp. sativa]
MCLLQVRQVLGLSTEWPHHPLYFPESLMYNNTCVNRKIRGSGWRLRIASTCLCLVEIFQHLHEQLKQWFSFSLTSKENSTGSLSVYCVLTPNVTKKIFAEEVNTAFTDSTEKELKGILKVCDEPPVSVDFRCSDVSSPIDSTLTMVMGDDMVKVIVWYDNEWGLKQ